MQEIQYNWQLLLISIFVYVISIFIAKPQITFQNPQDNNTRKGTIAFFLLLMVNSVFAFWAEDTYHSWGVFIFAKQYQIFEILGFEEVYNNIATFTNNTYFYWRAFVWIPACLFIYYTAKRLDILNRNFLVSMLLFGSFLSYTRGMLGHTMLLFGAVLFVEKRSNMLTKIIGLTLVCVSYYFHKSMYVNIIFAVLALFPFGKKTVVLSLIAFPFLTTIATYLINGIVSGEIELALGEGVGGVGDRTEMYASGGERNLNLNGKIGWFIRIIPEYLTLFYLFYKVMIQKVFDKDKREKVYKYLFRLTYVAFYIASLFLFVEASDWIYERFKYMGFFPLVFILGAVWIREVYATKCTKIIILLELFLIILFNILKLKSWYVL